MLCILNGPFPISLLHLFYDFLPLLQILMPLSIRTMEVITVWPHTTVNCLSFWFYISPFQRTIAQETERRWEGAIEEALERNLNTLLSQGMRHKSQKAVSLYPYLKVLPPADYVRIIIQVVKHKLQVPRLIFISLSSSSSLFIAPLFHQEIRRLAEGSETYSPGVSQLYRELGHQVLSRYQLLYKDRKGILDKVEELYGCYLKWYLEPGSEPSSSSSSSSSVVVNSRQKWQSLLHAEDYSGPHVVSKSPFDVNAWIHLTTNHFV